MDFTMYQQRTNDTAMYPTCLIITGEDATTEARWIYPALGMAGEAGEVLEKLKKIMRDKQGLISPDDAKIKKKEIGDVQYYLAQLCEVLGYSLQQCAEENIQKLADRKARGVLQGSGDER